MLKSRTLGLVVVVVSCVAQNAFASEPPSVNSSEDKKFLSVAPPSTWSLNRLRVTRGAERLELGVFMHRLDDIVQGCAAAEAHAVRAQTWNAVADVFAMGAVTALGVDAYRHFKGDRQIWGAGPSKILGYAITSLVLNLIASDFATGEFAASLDAYNQGSSCQ